MNDSSDDVARRYEIQLPVAVIITADSTPNASGKHVSLPKQCTPFLSSGMKNVEINDPMEIAAINRLKNLVSWSFCSGNLNWSPPNVYVQGFIPPVPIATSSSAPMAMYLFTKHTRTVSGRFYGTIPTVLRSNPVTVSSQPFVQL